MSSTPRSNAPIKIWFNPSRLWRATKDLSPVQAEELMDRISTLCECRDFESLKDYDFIRVGQYHEVRWS
jgi:hypothetical protein